MSYVDSSSSTAPGGFSSKQFDYAGNAVNDLAGGISAYLGDQTKAAGLKAEATNDTLAAEYAGEEATVAGSNLSIQSYQNERQLSLAQGKTTSEVANAGFETSGSSLDILRMNAQNGALKQGVTQVQGENEIAGYKEQQAAYTNLASAANKAAGGEGVLGDISAAAGGVGAVLQVAAIFA